MRCLGEGRRLRRGHAVDLHGRDAHGRTSVLGDAQANAGEGIHAGGDPDEVARSVVEADHVEPRASVAIPSKSGHHEIDALRGSREVDGAGRGSGLLIEVDQRDHEIHLAGGSEPFRSGRGDRSRIADLLVIRVSGVGEGQRRRPDEAQDRDPDPCDGADPQPVIPQGAAERSTRLGAIEVQRTVRDRALGEATQERDRVSPGE